MSEQATCELCGEPMPVGEEMFKFHGYSGPCPKPPLPREPANSYESLLTSHADLLAALKGIIDIGKRDMSNPKYDGYFESAREAVERAEAPAR